MSGNIVVCHHFQVNNMEESIILMGENNSANNRSSHSKQNLGISVYSEKNTVTKSSVMIFDSDFADTVIDDRDIKCSIDNTGKPSKEMTFNIRDINVNNMIQNSALFIGEGQITGMDQHTKANLGIGNIRGFQNYFDKNVIYNEDRDTFDTLINDSDIKLFNKL